MAIHININIKKAKYLFRLFLFLTTCSLNIQAQNDPQPEIPLAFQQYLNLELDSSQANLDNIDDTTYAFYIENLLQTTEIFLSDDEEYYKSEKEYESKSLDKISLLKINNAASEFLRAEIKIQWAILKMKFGDEVSAFWDLKQAYHITRKNIQEHTEFIPSYKSMGLLEVLFGIVPDKYDWFLALFGLDGDVEHGISSLTKVLETKGNYSIESGILIALLHAYLLNSPQEGLNIMEAIQVENNFLLVEYVNALILIKNGGSADALYHLEQAVNKQASPLALPQIYYLLGEIYLQKGLLDPAIDQYQMFISQQKGKALIKDAHYKIGICYFISDRNSKADKYFKLANTIGWTKNEADKYAQSQLDSKIFSNKKLYQLRYATDGGFYKEARKIQSDIDLGELNGRDICEYYYRTARLMHKTGNIELAVENYQKTIASQKDEPWYFAANACLQLGLIYYDQGSTELSEEYLNKVFDYKNHPYEKSIRQKAKAKLKSLD